MDDSGNSAEVIRNSVREAMNTEGERGVATKKAHREERVQN